GFVRHRNSLQAARIFGLRLLADYTSGKQFTANGKPALVKSPTGHAVKSKWAWIGEGRVRTSTS
ncbi:MAG TPA: hypothetical protein VGX94_09250, partial [Terriglobia bacterium]|nr:hypothetical protein [Terriglobia bacterium]